MEITKVQQQQQQKQNICLNGDDFKRLWDINIINIHIIEVSEGRENALEKIFKEIVTENVPNLG